MTADTQTLADAIFAPIPVSGIKQGGHFIPTHFTPTVGVVGGFYIPEADYQLALDRANLTGKLQFVGLAKDGSAIHGSRDSLHADPNCDGLIAWIFPRCDRA